MPKSSSAKLIPSALRLVQQARCAVALLHQDALGQLELEPAGLHPGLAQHLADPALEAAALELARRHVDREPEVRQTRLAPRAVLQAGGAQHPQAERLDQAVLLGERHEVVGQDEAELGMAPADQRLEPHDLPAVERDLRLVDQLELVLLERAPQMLLAHHLLEHPHVQRRVVQLQAVAATLLGAVERHVGALQQLIRAHAVAGIEADADARGDVQLVAVDVEGRADRLEDLLRRLDRVLGASQAAQDEDELVAAHAGDGVLVAHAGAQTTR